MPESPAIDLDRLDPSARAALDPYDMMGLVQHFPEQCRSAIEIGRRFRPLPGGAPIRSVVFAGLGGSAIGADMARSLMLQLGSVPMLVSRDYTLPRFVGPSDLVIAGSYSGETEETLAAYAAARAAGAQIAAITSGGTLAKLAVADGYPVAPVPGGQPPRSATGYLFFPLISYLVHAGLLALDVEREGAGVVARLEQIREELGPEVPTDRNSAKQLARALHGRIPVIYGSQGYRGVIAERWKGQFNENCKQAAFTNVLPEMNHNEILAWTLAPKQAPNWSIVFLRDRTEIAESPRIARRIEISRELIGDAAPIHEIWGDGETVLERMFSLFAMGDYMSVYLAYLNGVCPTQMDWLAYLKAELQRL